MAISCPPLNSVAVIFVSQRNGEDETGYAAAAAAMEEAAAQQPGYCGFIAARGADGVGIAVSYWDNDEAAAAWRDHSGHVGIQEQGRARWYDAYALAVANVARSYDWQRVS